MKKIGLSLFCIFCSTVTIIACSGFYITQGDRILAGNNEDFINPKTKMWVIPGEKGKYGKIFFGFDDYSPQGGINEKGLFFDGFATELKKVLKSAGKPRYEKVYDNLQSEILSTCATIEDVIAFLNNYNLEFLENAMLFFGDSNGNSMIIEGDTIIRKKGNFQIITNFRQSEAKNFTCERYNKMYKMLSQNRDMSIDYCKGILDAVHAEGRDGNSATLYSQVYDIKNLIIYVYNFHDFNNFIKIDLKEELKKGLRYYDLPSLFPKNLSFQQFEDEYMRKIYNEIKRREIHNPDANNFKQFKGTYILKSLTPISQPFYEDSTKHILINFDGDKLVYNELYGNYFKANLIPESDRAFFYKINFGEFRVSFTTDKNDECICEAILNNQEKYTWTCKKIK
jgi:hypothetical protein